MRSGKAKIKQYMRRFFCGVLVFSFLPLHACFMTTNAADGGIEELPYETDSLFVKLAAPSNSLSIMADVGAAMGTIAGDMKPAEAAENKKTVADYGDVSLLFSVSPDSGTGVSAFSAAASEAWYVLELNDGQNVDEVYAALDNDPDVLAVNYNFKISVVDSEVTDGPLSIEEANEFPAVGTSASSIDTANIYYYNDYQSVIMQNTGVAAAQSYLEEHGMAPRGSSDVVVAILDTGVDYTHPELADSILRDADGNIIGYDATRGGGDPGPDENFNNQAQVGDYMHGTHCAGIVAAKGIKVLGVASGVKIMPVTIKSSVGGDFKMLINGIKFAVSNGADIINISLGINVTERPSNTTTAMAVFTNSTDANALHDLIKKYCGQVLFVAAAGNAGAPNEVANGRAYNRSYPACWPEVFGVMNTVSYVPEGADWLNSTSNWDVNANNEYEYDIMAPGTNIMSTIPLDSVGRSTFDNGYDRRTGTSQAAPFVSGCLALLLTQYKDGIERGEFTVQDMLSILIDNSEIKQGIIYEGVRYKYPYVRIDNALEFRTELDVELAPYHYFYNGVSNEADRGVSGALAFRKDNGEPVGRVLNYDYKYEKKHLVENTGDYITEEIKTVPTETGEYEVTVNVDDLYYAGTATSLYTVFDRQCDFNGDGQISYLDMEIYKRHLGTWSGAASGNGRTYEPLLDLNGDGKISISDVQVLISMRYRESLKKAD